MARATSKFPALFLLASVLSATLWVSVAASGEPLEGPPGSVRPCPTPSSSRSSGPISTAGPPTITPPPSTPSRRAASPSQDQRSRSDTASGLRRSCGRLPARGGREAARTPRRRAPSSRRISARCGSPSSASRRVSSPAISSRSCEGSRFPNPEFHVPLYRRPRDLVAAGHKRRRRQLPKQGRQVGRLNDKKRARALLRSRRHRGRRARRPQARDLLDARPVRGAVDPDPGLGARAASRTARCCASTTTPTTAIPIPRSAAC